MEELISRVAATAQSDLKLPDEQLPTIKRYVKRAINRIKVFCNREDFPEPLEDVAALGSYTVLTKTGLFL